MISGRFPPFFGSMEGHPFLHHWAQSYQYFVWWEIRNCNTFTRDNDNLGPFLPCFWEIMFPECFHILFETVIQCIDNFLSFFSRSGTTTFTTTCGALRGREHLKYFSSIQWSNAPFLKPAGTLEELSFRVAHRSFKRGGNLSIAKENLFFPGLFFQFSKIERQVIFSGRKKSTLSGWVR